MNDLIENVKSNHPTDYSEITGTIHIKDSLLGISIINTGFMQNEREVLHVAFILSRYMNVPVLTYTDGQIVWFVNNFNFTLKSKMCKGVKKYTK